MAVMFEVTDEHARAMLDALRAVHDHDDAANRDQQLQTDEDRLLTEAVVVELAKYVVDLTDDDTPGDEPSTTQEQQ